MSTIDDQENPGAEVEETTEATEVSAEKHGKYTQLINDAVAHRLTGMYKDWFLDYASYVILERAVPHLDDGLKPVQRRILHSMKRMDDGRYNKVANIIGFTMQFHPHGDASIGDALVQLGQKDLLIDTQGNWGNILTGDSAAAPRYIEARLSKLALDVVFNPKTTEWMLSYDGRNQEPVTLPVKFPLLLAQGCCPFNFRWWWPRASKGLPWGWLPRFFPTTLSSCWRLRLPTCVARSSRSIPISPPAG